MTTINDKNKSNKNNKNNNNSAPIYGIFHPSVLERKVHLNINQVGENVKKNLEDKLNDLYCNKCIPEGIIRNDSIKLVTYSAGNVNGELISFICVFDCFVCNPVENMIIECNIKTITKAGIHCEYFDKESKSVPLHIFVARDHHFNNEEFNKLKEKDEIRIKVIGTRYELNDPYICVIASLVNKNIKIYE